MMQKLNEWIATEIMLDETIRVCKSLGCRNPDQHNCKDCLRTKPENITKPFCTDLELAMKAAKKALYGCMIEFPSVHNPKYEVCERSTGDWGQAEYNFISEHEHPATAICLAIYKLKTGEDWKE